MLDLFLLSFVLAFIGAGLRRPFIFVLAYTYIDIVSPQKVSWGILSHIPVSLIAFLCAFVAWFVAEDKNGTRISLRQILLLALLVYCGLTTQTADFPVEAAEKWAWVWKALLFAMFLPLTLRTRLRIEALTLIMVLSVGVIVIGGGIKTLAGGGGYGELRLLVNNNTGLYESSIISAVAIAVIPLALWLSRFGTVFPPEWRVKAFAWALCFACALMPIGTGARTGLVCVVVLAAMILRTAKRRLLIISLMAAGAIVSIPMLPADFVARMSTIRNHQSDESASTRVAEFNDLASVEAGLAHEDVAVLIMEPALTNIGIVLPEPGFLEAVRELCTRYGTLLLIDETHTISAGPGGCTAAWGLQPDIFVIGKSIGGGIPSGAYGITQAVADAVRNHPEADLVDVGGVGGTLAGNVLSTAAMRKVTSLGRSPQAKLPLTGVKALAGYLLLPDGRRMLFVGIVNHGNAEAAQKALDSAVDWVYLTEAAKLKALTR